MKEIQKLFPNHRIFWGLADGGKKCGWNVDFRKGRVVYLGNDTQQAISKAIEIKNRLKSGFTINQAVEAK